MGTRCNKDRCGGGHVGHPWDARLPRPHSHGQARREHCVENDGSLFSHNEMSLINSKFRSIIREQASKKDKSDKDIETTVSQVLTGPMY